MLEKGRGWGGLRSEHFVAGDEFTFMGGGGGRVLEARRSL